MNLDGWRFRRSRLVAAPPVDRRIYVIALANPDGYRRIEDDLWAGKRRFRRTNAHGVDLRSLRGTDDRAA